MATATYNDSRKSADRVAVFADPAALHEVLDEVFAEMPQREAPQREEPVAPLPRPPATVRRKPAARPAQVAYQPRPRARVPTDDGNDWAYYLKQTICVGVMLLGAVLFYRGMPSSWRAAINRFVVSPAATAGSTPASHTPGEKGLRTKRIEDARVGDRLFGRNPIREQADLVEPDPATWRKISLYMTKESGLGLWIDLLRPLTWIEEHNAKLGSTIFIDLDEMGAVGDAEVTYLGPCPKIQPGTGTVVTGTFKHQADENSNVVNLNLEDQIELTSVTANHPYWSADRREFVEVGKLRTGELVDTEFGLKHVVSVTPIESSEFLYNLETTEHVYRVGSLGTLVHNSCVNLHDIIPYSRQAPGFEKHHGLLDQWAAANKLSNYTKYGAPTIVMTAAEHNATRRVFGQWRFERTGSINGAIDWTKVTPLEMQSLSNRMLDAANIPQGVRDSYMQALNRFLYTGSF